MMPGLSVDFRTKTLRRGGFTARFASLRYFRMVTALLVAPGGITSEELVDHCWGDDPDGGPLKPRILIYSFLEGAKARLARLGLRVVTSRLGSIGAGA